MVGLLTLVLKILNLRNLLTVHCEWECGLVAYYTFCFFFFFAHMLLQLQYIKTGYKDYSYGWKMHKICYLVWFTLSKYALLRSYIYRAQNMKTHSAVSHHFLWKTCILRYVHRNKYINSLAYSYSTKGNKIEMLQFEIWTAWTCVDCSIALKEMFFSDERNKRNF